MGSQAQVCISDVKIHDQYNTSKPPTNPDISILSYTVQGDDDAESLKIIRRGKLALKMAK